MRSRGDSALRFAVLIAIASGCAPRPAGLSAGEHQLIQRCLGLEYPYAVAEWVGYGDGGSLTGVITDATGAKLNFWWDQRASLPGTSNISPLGCIYLGAKVPADPAGVRLDIGSPCETAFIEALRAIANDQLSRARQDSLYGFLYDSSIPMPERKPGYDALKPAELQAMRALALAKTLEEQRVAHP